MIDRPQEMEAEDAGLRVDPEIAKLYREGATEQSPARLDDIILADSRWQAQASASGRRRHKARTPFAGNHWLAPTSLAAVIVVSVTLVTWTPAPEVPMPVNVLVPEAAPQNSSTAALPPSAKRIQPVAIDPVRPEAGFAGSRPATTPELETGLLKATSRSAISTSQDAPPRGAINAKQWLRRIESLLEDGLQDEARLDFYAFREQYPNHPVPEDLLGRLGM